LIQLLSGYAYREPPTPPTREELFEAFPWMEALEIFLHSPECGRHFEGTVTRLLDCLNKTAETEGLKSHGRNWPKSAPVFGKYLEKNKALFPHLGIELDRDRVSWKRTIILAVMTSDDSNESGSKQPKSPEVDQNTTGNDASDNDFMDVFKKILPKEASNADNN
jgi:hypothetical protein